MLLSIDIGTKNLSYCLLSRLPNAKIHIHDWNILNLTKNKTLQQQQAAAAPVAAAAVLCTHTKEIVKKRLKTIEIVSCNNNAAYRHPETGAQICNTHAKTYVGYKNPELKPSYIRKCNLEKITELVSKYLPAAAAAPPPPPQEVSETTSKKRKREAATKPEMVKQMLEFSEKNVLVSAAAAAAAGGGGGGGGAAARGVNARFINPKTLAENVYVQFEHTFPAEVLQNITHVIIEKQMTSKMTMMQGMLVLYFRTRKPSLVIECVNASNKLNQYKGTEVEEWTEVRKKKEIKFDVSNYDARKDSAIMICHKFVHGGGAAAAAEGDKRKVDVEMIENREDWKKKFDGEDKKDDLSDCLLQGIWYLFC